MTIIGTDNGLYRWDEATGSVEPIGLQGHRIRDVARCPDQSLIAVESGKRVWMGRPGDAPWVDLTRGLAEAPTTVLVREGDGTVYVGTEPPAVYRLDRETRTWQVVEALHEREEAEDWYAPGGPPAVRSMAAHPGNPQGLYLDIHVGGIMRTLDGGATWTPVNDGLELDVHQVATHPRRPEAIYTATADGFYFSPDEGVTWERRNQGLEHLYTRGIAIHPDAPDVLLISGSPTSPGGWGRRGKRFALFRSENGGQQWHRMTKGMPNECPEEIDTFCLAFSRMRPDEALCGRRDGVLHLSRDAGATWETVTEALPPVYAIWAG